jgi:hypothetical protein
MEAWTLLAQASQTDVLSDDRTVQCLVIAWYVLREPLGRRCLGAIVHVLWRHGAYRVAKSLDPLPFLRE